MEREASNIDLFSSEREVAECQGESLEEVSSEHLGQAGSLLFRLRPLGSKRSGVNNYAWTMSVSWDVLK